MNNFEFNKVEIKNKVWYTARCRPLGLTAHGDTKEKACNKLKEMFAYLVDLNMRRPAPQEEK